MRLETAVVSGQFALQESLDSHDRIVTTLYAADNAV